MRKCSNTRILAVSAVLMLLVSFGGSASFASSGGIAAPPRQMTNPEQFAPWTDPANNECGMDCLYRKANENIGLEAKYVYEKLIYLDQVKGDDDKVRASLGNFCTPDEAAIDCKERFQKVAVLYLNKARAAMIKNSDSASKLLASRVPVSGGALPNEAPNDAMFFGKGVDPNAASPKPQKPYIPTFAELQKQHADMRRLGTNDYRAWVDQLPRKPAKEDFIKSREIWRDPENPSAGKMTIIDSKPDGSPNYDEAAYAKALASYEHKMKLEMGDFEKMKAKTPSAADTYAKAIMFEKARPPGQKPAEGSQEDLWNHSRAPLVYQSNLTIRNSGMEKFPSQQVVSYAGKGKSETVDAAKRVPANNNNVPKTLGVVKSQDQLVNNAKVPQQKKIVSEDEAYRNTHNGTDTVSEVRTFQEAGKNTDIFTGYSPEYFAPRYLDEFDLNN